MLRSVNILICFCLFLFICASNLHEEIDDILGGELYNRLFQLGQISQQPSPILSRPAFTNSQIAAIELIAKIHSHFLCYKMGLR